jgi:hypothetical protein
MNKPRKNIVIFSFKLVVFVFILGVIINFFLIPFASDVGTDTRYLRSLKKVEKNDYDIFFFGNSYSFTALDPLTIKERIDLNAIHLSAGAQRLEATVAVANEVINKYNPRFIFFDVSGPSLPSPKKDAENIWYYQTLGLQETALSLDKIKKVTDFYPVEEYREYYASALSKKLGRLFRLNNRKDYVFNRQEPSYKTSEKTVYFSANGFIANRQKPIDKEKFKKSFYTLPGESSASELDSRWSESLVQSMDGFLEKAEAMNINVIFVNSLKLYATNYKSEILDGYVGKYSNVRFLDLNLEKKEYSLNETSFYNSTHLNYSGSIQVTNRVVDSLSKWFNIPKRNKTLFSFNNFNLKNYSLYLNKNEDKFIKFEFDSIPKSLKDYQLVVSLFTKDSLELSDYSKTKKIDSDNFYVKLNDENIITTETSSIIIKRFKTKISNETIDKMKVFFYKPNDTLKLPIFEFYSKDEL